MQALDKNKEKEAKFEDRNDNDNDLFNPPLASEPGLGPSYLLTAPVNSDSDDEDAVSLYDVIFSDGINPPVSVPLSAAQLGLAQCGKYTIYDVDVDVNGNVDAFKMENKSANSNQKEFKSVGYVSRDYYSLDFGNKSPESKRTPFEDVVDDDDGDDADDDGDDADDDGDDADDDDLPDLDSDSDSKDTTFSAEIPYSEDYTEMQEDMIFKIKMENKHNKDNKESHCQSDYNITTILRKSQRKRKAPVCYGYEWMSKTKTHDKILDSSKTCKSQKVIIEKKRKTRVENSTDVKAVTKLKIKRIASKQSWKKM